MDRLNEFFINKYYKYTPKESVETRGFFFFNPPTGSGKTNATMRYIANLIKSKSKRKIFYITNLKENLDKPLDDLGKLVKSDKRVLRLKSKEDELFRLCENNLWKEPKSVRFESFKSFKRAVERLYVNQNSSLDYRNFLRDTYEEEEQRFRFEILNAIKELKGKRDKSTLNLLRRELKRIYRTIDMLKDYDVVFLTTHRFLYPIYDPFLGSNYIYNMRRFKDNSICFIDEFDSQKDIFLQIEIEKFLKETKDYISIFLKIYAGLEHKRFLKKFGSQTEWEGVKERFSQVYRRNNLQYSHKLHGEPSQIDVLFKDIEYFSIDKGYFYLKVDKKSETNVIVPVTPKKFEETKDEGLGLLNSLNDIITSINFFISTVGFISIKYHQDNTDNLEFSNVISTILHELNIDEKVHRFLKDKILERETVKRGEYYSDWSKDAFYDRGFRYFYFHNSLNFNTKTDIYFKIFDNTPEKILAKIAQRSFIVGISATALNRSVTANFKIDYLKNRFKENFFQLTKRELEELERLYIDVKQDKIENYYVKVIDYNLSSEYEFKVEAQKLFSDDFDYWIELMCGNGLEYQINRYFRVVQAYLEFKKNSDIQSFLCLVTTYPKGGDEVNKYENGINKEHLDKLIKSALEKGGIDYEEELYFIYNSEDKSAKIYEDEIKPKLKRGERIFLISTYQGLGIGKNIQYIVDEDRKKDFDAIYLEKPTFLLERIDRDKEKMERERSLIKYIYQLETLYNSEQISRIDLVNSIKFAFDTTFNRKFFKSSFSHKSTRDYIDSASRVIIQAIGRLHRTAISERKYIFVDKNLSFLKNYENSNSFNLLSFKALIKYLSRLESSNKVKNGKYNLTQVVHEKNFRVRSRIEDSLNLINSPYRGENIRSRIQEWKDIREFVLKNPTLDKMDKTIQDIYEDLYFNYLEELKFPKYYYIQKRDYRIIESISSEKMGQEVSEENVKLDLIRKSSYLKEKFEEYSYALNFNGKNRYIITPVVYNNIYKGALGEKVGKFLLEQGGDVKLLDLEDDEFEKFDYKTKNGVYIDFKYFGESTAKNTTTDFLVSKAESKLSEIGGTRAIIINCFGSSRYKIKATKSNKVSIYPFIIREDSKIEYEVIEEIKGEIKSANKSI